MGFLTPTWVTCAKCREEFACGCVIESICPDCKKAACSHEYMEPLDGISMCKKCFSIKPPQID